MSTRIDGIIKDWGDRIDYGYVHGRKSKTSKTIAGNSVSKVPNTKPSGSGGRRKLLATVRKAPEVVVKISGGGKDLRSIKAHMDYISRNGAVELEDEQKRIHLGKDDIRAVRDDWRGGVIPAENGKRREAFNIILSMPPGTDRRAVKDAARAFAAELFNNHQYAFAAHEDERHPHVHVVVKAVDRDGIRLNPRKADLQHWRETFAEKLREQGVRANATPRHLRGVVKRAEKQAVLHMNQEYAKGQRAAPAHTTFAQNQAVELEARTGLKHVNPAERKIIARRKHVQYDFGTVARALASGDQNDQRLAMEVVQFVRRMPPLKTRHVEQVEALQQRPRSAQGGTSKEKSEHGHERNK